MSKIKKTQKIMEETRKEDSILLRKKSEELIQKLNEDRIFLFDSKQKLIQQLNKIENEIYKNTGALDILKILLEK